VGGKLAGGGKGETVSAEGEGGGVVAGVGRRVRGTLLGRSAGREGNEDRFLSRFVGNACRHWGGLVPFVNRFKKFLVPVTQDSSWR